MMLSFVIDEGIDGWTNKWTGRNVCLLSVWSGEGIKRTHNGKRL